ncbi:MAG: TonB-dependent receptor family protein [Bacteroidales bacterium]|jgi:hypothetical protein|nr:TonB-dependent receptor family protein [Bacteroidales bacterium]
MSMKNSPMFEKRSLITLFLIFLYSFSLSAQNALCQGEVRDALSNEPIPYATVRLLNTLDSTLYAGCITDETGRFLMKKLQKDNYLCCITYVGYLPVCIPVSTIEKQNFDLGKINLSLSNDLLQEVVIEGTMQIRKMIDRSVYQIDSAILAHAAKTSDIFKKIPEVYVNSAGEIAIKGKNATMIMVNGILSPEKENIKSIDIHDIENVEIITAPSSEYGTEIDGIINIILKEKMKAGYYFNIGGSWWSLPFNRVAVGGAFRYNSEKIRYRFSANYSYNSPKKQWDSIYRENFDENDNLSVYQSIDIPQKKIEQNIFIDNNLDYYINKNNFLHFSSRNVFFPNTIKTQGFATNSMNNALINSISSFTDKDTDYNTGNYTFFYRRKFNKEHQLFSSNFNFYHMTTANNSKYEEIKLENAPYSSPHSRNTTEKANRYSYNLKVDYYHPISQKVSFSTGVLGYYQMFFNDYQDGGFSDTTYKYSDLKAHAYLDFSFNFNDFGFRIGNKIESFFTYLKNVPEINQTSYLPSIMVLKKFGATQSLSLSYRAVNFYPNVWILTPYVTYSADSLTAHSGNPNIKPGKLHNVSLNYVFRKGVTYLQLGALYQYMQNAFSNESSIIEQKTLLYKPVNISGKNKFSLEVIPSLDFDFLIIETTLTPYYEYFQANNDHRKNFNFDLSLSVYWYLPYDFEFDVDFTYKGKALTSQGCTKQYPEIDFYLSKTFLKGNMEVNISYSGLFFSTAIINVIEQDYFYQWMKEDNTMRGFSIGLSYRFRKGKEYQIENIQKYQDNDLKKI